MLKYIFYYLRFVFSEQIFVFVNLNVLLTLPLISESLNPHILGTKYCEFSGSGSYITDLFFVFEWSSIDYIMSCVED